MCGAKEQAAYHASMDELNEQQAEQLAENAWADLRGHTTGEMMFEDHLRPVKYCIEPDEGRLVSPVMYAMLSTVDTTLFIPECVEEATEVQITIEPFEERGPNAAFCDRWRVYHGEPQDMYWAFLNVDAVRYQGAIIDGEALMRPNPLAHAEPRICKHMNEDHKDDMRLLCEHYAQVIVEDPVMVGVDPMGIDVRGRFDVIRVPAIRRMQSDQDVRPVLVDMVEQARAAQ